jgi:hypothetical protein
VCVWVGAGIFRKNEIPVMDADQVRTARPATRGSLAGSPHPHQRACMHADGGYQGDGRQRRQERDELRWALSNETR